MKTAETGPALEHSTGSPGPHYRSFILPTAPALEQAEKAANVVPSGQQSNCDKELVETLQRGNTPKFAETGGLPDLRLSLPLQSVTPCSPTPEDRPDLTPGRKSIFTRHESVGDAHGDAYGLPSSIRRLEKESPPKRAAPLPRKMDLEQDRFLDGNADKTSPNGGDKRDADIDNAGAINQPVQRDQQLLGRQENQALTVAHIDSTQLVVRPSAIRQRSSARPLEFTQKMPEVEQEGWGFFDFFNCCTSRARTVR